MNCATSTNGMVSRSHAMVVARQWQFFWKRWNSHQAPDMVRSLFIDMKCLKLYGVARKLFVMTGGRQNDHIRQW